VSAFFSFRYPDRIQLLTDGGFFDDAGILRHVGRKVFAAEGMPLAVTGRGTEASQVFGMCKGIVDHCSAIASYGGTVDGAMEALRRAFERRSAEGPTPVEFLIAAYSATKGPLLYFIQLHGGNDVPSFEMIDAGQQIAAGPAIGWDDLAHLGLAADDLAASDFPERYGAEIIGAMRSKRGLLPGGKAAIFGVGGLCSLTTVTKDGVRIRELCDFPDMIGQKVNPFGDHIARAA